MLNLRTIKSSIIRQFPGQDWLFDRSRLWGYRHSGERSNILNSVQEMPLAAACDSLKAEQGVRELGKVSQRGAASKIGKVS